MLTLPKEKIAQDANFPFGGYVLRPLAMRVAPYIRLSANKVTWIGLVVGLLGLAGLCSGKYWIMIIGAFMVNLNLFIDHIDGPIARTTGTTSLHGQWLDGFSGYVVEMGVPVSVGIGLVGENVLFVVLGLCVALVRCFSRLASAYHQRVFGEGIISAGKQPRIYRFGLLFLSIEYPMLLIFIIAGIPDGYLTLFLLAALGELGVICLKSYNRR